MTAGGTFHKVVVGRKSEVERNARTNALWPREMPARFDFDFDFDREFEVQFMRRAAKLLKLNIQRHLPPPLEDIMSSTGVESRKVEQRQVASSSNVAGDNPSGDAASVGEKSAVRDVAKPGDR